MKKLLLALAIPLLMGASCSLFGGDKVEEKASAVNEEVKEEEVIQNNEAEESESSDWGFDDFKGPIKLGKSGNEEKYSNIKIEDTNLIRFESDEFNFSLDYPDNWDMSNLGSGSIQLFTFNSVPYEKEFVYVSPGGEGDFGIPQNHRTEEVVLANRKANREIYWDDGQEPVYCYYQFTVAPTDNWIIPNSEGKYGNRIQTPCEESEVVKEILETFKFLDEDKNVDTLRIYNNSEVGFSFKHPSNMKEVDNIYNNEDLAYKVSILKVEDIQEDAPACGDKQTALDNIEYLKNGNPEKVCLGWHPLIESIKLVNLGEVNAQDSVTLRSWDICDLSFERELLFYYNGYQVDISIVGPFSKIINSMSDYFGDNVCGEAHAWIDDDDIESKFYNELLNRTASPVAQEWYDSFDDIVETIKFSD